MNTSTTVPSEVKECPVCHAWCFSDMDVCYGCLYDFTKEQSARVSARDAERVTNQLSPEQQPIVELNESASSAHAGDIQLQDALGNEVSVTTTNNKLPQLLDLKSGQQLEVTISVRVVESPEKA